MRHLLFYMLMATVLGGNPQRIEDFQWKNRIVLYFPGSSAPFPKLTAELKEEIQERKIVYFVFGDDLNTNSQVDFSAAYLLEIKKKFGSGCEGACWILIGLDGGVKLRREGELDWDYIFKTVDSMPMRRLEIRQKT